MNESIDILKLWLSSADWIIPTIVARTVSTQRTVSIRAVDKSTVAQSKIYSSTNWLELRRFSERATRHNRFIKCSGVPHRRAGSQTGSICQGPPPPLHNWPAYANQFHNASGRTRGGIRWFNGATGGRFTYCGRRRGPICGSWNTPLPHKRKRGRFLFTRTRGSASKTSWNGYLQTSTLPLKF